MTFNDNASLNTSGVRRGGRGAAIGGGLGGFGLIGAVLYFMLTGQIPDFGQSYEAPVNAHETPLSEMCRTGADANHNVECRMVAGMNSINNFWNQQLPQETGTSNRQPELVLYSGSVQTACGLGTSQTGPFFCGGDDSIYIDVAFFDQLNQMGARNEELAQLYILAHEYGHHIQLMTGILQRIDHHSSGEDSSMVRSELQADCLAGAWIHNASHTVDEHGNQLMKAPTAQELQDALAAAQAVGDDRIYESAGMQANPDNFSHGSAEKRMEWLTRGMENGTFAACNTWDVAHP
ncbi:neutral zinc metallopeptidase [Trueperella sp. LYQ143]|uniref:KPN_02809 family neutral zinc metallopeptidase n=1 Tax=unclassified Trueperella TaxID=2630174 RepID=UPI00398348A6